ncbi:MAG TPA: type III PLP-dependent enzyme [Spirochaetia bacterium]|nr:type III PLP-dependent enzyme [Spirochaetia bacterium]
MLKENYYFPLDRYMTRERFERVREFSKDKETPFLIIDLEAIRRRYLEMKSALPFSQIYYAIKANPNDEVIKLLHSLGSCFDVATRFELDQLLSLGVEPERMSFGNTIKKADDIRYFYEKGIRLYVTDSQEDLVNIAVEAPGSRVFFRLLTEGTGSDWPLSRKFGAHSDMIYYLIIEARNRGLEPYGFSFHVGSQQRDIGQWDDAIARCKYLFDALEADEGISLKMINLGGGFPANYLSPTLPMDVYASEIKRFLIEDFGEQLPEIYMEPGRAMTADSGVIVSEIIRISKKSKNNLYRWAFLDVGLFGGLIETLGEAIKYPIYFEGQGESEEIILAGPTCDSMDIMYQDFKYRMPSNTKEGDRVYIFTTGAYTQSYSSIYFNGFPPLKSYILPLEDR